MLYDRLCLKCETVFEVECSIAHYKESVRFVCPKCKSDESRAYIAKAPAVTIPGNMTFDGKSRTLADGEIYKEPLKAPISFETAKADGTKTVHVIEPKKRSIRKPKTT